MINAFIDSLKRDYYQFRLKRAVKKFKMHQYGLSDARFQAAMVRFYQDQDLQLAFNIVIANLIRRHVSVSSMLDQKWLSGQVQNCLNWQQWGKESVEAMRQDGLDVDR